MGLRCRWFSCYSNKGLKTNILEAFKYFYKNTYIYSPKTNHSMKRFFAFVSALILGLSCTNTIEKADIPVASVSISRSSAELVEGESLTLTASVSPSDATEKTVSWSSSKPSVASVDQKGTVNALSVGTAVIKASAGGKNDSCTITVISKTIEVSSIALDKSSLSLKIGEEYQLNATINPNNASERNVSWSSSSSSIATVKDGLVKGISAGETEITASCGGKKAVCKVKITPIDVESVSLSKTELDLFVGDSENITATIKPENASDQQITWSSSDSRIATVSKGTITGVKEGNVVITAKAGSKTADCKVNVKTKGTPVSSISLSRTTVFMISGGREVLTATVNPSNATEKDVKWSSSNSSVVSVSNGILSAKSIGRATITATAGGVSSSCEVEVVNENDRRVDYFCIDVLGGGDLHIYYPRQGVLEYSMDSGKNWTTFNFKWDYAYPGTKQYFVKLSCSSGDKVMLRGTWKYHRIDQETYQAYNIFGESTITANISGHLLSIIKQDSFWDSDTDQHIFEDGGWYQANRDPLGDSAFRGVRIVSAKDLILPTKNPVFVEMFKDCTFLQDAPSLPSTDLSKGSYEEMFSGCTILKEAPQLPATILSEFCYAGMFTDCISIEEAPKLPATSLPQGCYSMMFSGCTSLKTVPALSAMRMYYREYNYSHPYANGCCSRMFENCTSLRIAPALPATTLARECYEQMFLNCMSLEKAPDLPALTMSEYCYCAMFGNCIALKNAPRLPATKLADYCYSTMFSGCTSLVNAPDLPATSLSEKCYSGMFANCVSMTSAPSLPATTVQNGSYSSMFSGCTSLITAPRLPATHISEKCYFRMFNGCSSLSSAPDLPAFYLANNCYQEMFKDCSHLKTAPLLPALSLTTECYKEMFRNCRELNYVEAMFLVVENGGLTDWLKGVSDKGTFVKNKDAKWTKNQDAGIPYGWNLIVSN